MELISLFVPCFLLILLLTSVFLLFIHKWQIGICGLIICGCLNWMASCWTLSIPSFHDETETLKVMSFNCNLSPKNAEILEQRAKTVELIKSESPEVIFLTENFFKIKDSLWLALNDIYPYHTSRNSSVGNYIYSKYPILSDTVFKEKGIPYGISICEIKYKDSTIDIFGCHLSSNNYNEHMEYMTPDSVNNRHEIKTYLKNILAAGKHRQLEAKTIIDFHDSSRATIIMGDFNDVCGSPTLEIFENAGFKDAWWEGGLGYGATIHHPLPFRIDHIMYNDKLMLKSVKKIDANGISDHDALQGTFIIKNK